MQRESIVFYRSFYEAIKEFKSDVQQDIYTAIMEYGLYGKEANDLKPIADAIFKLIKPQIDANNTRYENGKKGGRKKPPSNQGRTKSEPNDKVNDNDNDNEKVKEKANANPTSDEVADYFESNGYPRELGIKAFNHYDRLNWQDSNGNKVKNWKNKCKSVWMSRHDEQQSQKQIKPKTRTVKYIRYRNGNGVVKVDPEDIFEQRLGAYPFLIDNMIEKFEKEERIV